MSDSNMIAAYSWSAGLLQQDLPLSLMDVNKRAKLVNEINAPLIRGSINNNTSDRMLEDLDENEKNFRLEEIAKVSMSYFTEQDDKIRKSILLRLWAGCIDAAKAVRYTFVSGIKIEL